MPYALWWFRQCWQPWYFNWRVNGLGARAKKLYLSIAPKSVICGTLVNLITGAIVGLVHLVQPCAAMLLVGAETLNSTAESYKASELMSLMQDPAGSSHSSNPALAQVLCEAQVGFFRQAQMHHVRCRTNGTIAKVICEALGQLLSVPMILR